MVAVKFQDGPGHLVALGRTGQGERSDENQNSRHQQDPFHKYPPYDGNLKNHNIGE
jgi:hypothetical protein